jgi:peptidyl-tRNA hydrolase, PTH1 family
MWLVVGLGNPGQQYEHNRHNVGFMVIDKLAELVEADAFRSKFSGKLARAELRREDGWLFKPQTFMNLSGDAVQPCTAFYKIPPERVIVVHDELDVPYGEMRLKLGGGHAGNNGIRSISSRMGPEFIRLRFGIGRPTAGFRGDVSDWVLSDFNAEDREKLPKLVEQAAKSVLSIATRGVTAAMKTINTRPKKKRAPKPEPPPAEASNEADEATGGAAAD